MSKLPLSSVANKKQKRKPIAKPENLVFYYKDRILTHRISTYEELSIKLSKNLKYKPLWHPPMPMLPIDDQVLHLFKAMPINNIINKDLPFLVPEGEMNDANGMIADCPYMIARTYVCLAKDVADRRILMEAVDRTTVANFYNDVEYDTQELEESIGLWLMKYKNGIVPLLPRSDIVDLTDKPEIEKVHSFTYGELYRAILKLRQIKEAAENAIAICKDNDEKTNNMWEIFFAVTMASAWHTLTGEKPKHDEHFIGFVVAAFDTIYKAIDGHSSKRSRDAFWDAPVAAAVRTYEPGKMRRYPVSAAAASGGKASDVGAPSKPRARARARSKG